MSATPCGSLPSPMVVSSTRASIPASRSSRASRVDFSRSSSSSPRSSGDRMSRCSCTSVFPSSRGSMSPRTVRTLFSPERCAATSSRRLPHPPCLTPSNDPRRSLSAADRLRLGAQQLEPLRGKLDVEDLGYYLAPAVEEVQPAVLDPEVAGALLATSLAEEIQLPPVIELPDDAPLREASAVGQRGAGYVLAHPGGVHDQGPRRQAGQQLVVRGRIGVLDVFDPGRRATQAVVHPPQSVETLL